MDIGRLTTKSQEALRKSQELALSFGQQQVDVFHLLNCLIAQKGSIVPTIVKKVAVDLEKIQAQAFGRGSKISQNCHGRAGSNFHHANVDASAGTSRR